MSDLSSFQTTSFHTSLSFLDKENDDNLLEDEDEDEEDDEEYGPSGTLCVWLGRLLVYMYFRAVTNYLLKDVVSKLRFIINVHSQLSLETHLLFLLLYDAVAITYSTASCKLMQKMFVSRNKTNTSQFMVL